MLTGLVIRTTGPEDHRALALLRALWTSGAPDAELEQRMADWLAADGARRTTWLAERGDEAVGMASMLEYRRMPRADRPDSRWGYLSNMFVREDRRNRGIGSALLAVIVATADERGYARLVLSPSPRAVPLYRRAGFIVPDESAGDDRLLVRPRPF
jgi:GNAT superfamily N-acetyltransferase